jgi:hypothetical protein
MITWQYVHIEDRSASVFSDIFRAVAVATTGVDGALDSTGLALFWLRWLAGLIGLPILLLMSRMTLEIPNTQSATGILYVACLAVILGELTAQLLGMTVIGENSVEQPAQNKMWSEGAA